MIKLFLLAAAITFYTKASAQTSVYHPFPISDAEWRDINAHCDDPYTLPAYVIDYHYWLCGDTSFNNLMYQKLCSEHTVDEENYYDGLLLSSYYAGPYLYGAIREDSLRRIYYYDFFTHTDTLMYDFSNLSVGSSLPLTWVNIDSFAYISSIDSVLVGNTYRKAYLISDTTNPYMFPWPLYLIEGVGFNTGLLNGEHKGPGLRNTLLCFSQDQQLLFSQGFTSHHTCSTMVSVNDIANIKNVDVFPNPSSGPFSIHLSNDTQNALIEIYNLQGEKLYASAVSGNQHIIGKIFPSGIYFVKVTSDENQFIQKLIVE